MVLSEEEAKTCERNALNAYESVSPIYNVGDRRLCVLVSQRNDKKIEE